MKRIDTLKTREDFIRAAEAECGHGSKEVNCQHGCVFCNMSSEGGSYCQDIWECVANWLYAEVTEVPMAKTYAAQAIREMANREREVQMFVHYEDTQRRNNY